MKSGFSKMPIYSKQFCRKFSSGFSYASSSSPNPSMEQHWPFPIWFLFTFQPPEKVHSDHSKDWACLSTVAHVMSLPARGPCSPSLSSVVHPYCMLHLSRNQSHGMVLLHLSPSRYRTRLKWWIGFPLADIHITMVTTVSYRSRIVHSMRTWALE